MHASPDVLALLALGEEAGTPDERVHIESCADCRAEITDLARAVAAGREGRAGDSGLVSPPDRVWQAIRAELGFVGASEDAPSGSRGEPVELRTPTRRPSPAEVQADRSTPEEAGTNQVDPVAARTEPPVSVPRPTATVTNLADARSRTSRGRSDPWASASTHDCPAARPFGRAASASMPMMTTRFR